MTRHKLSAGPGYVPAAAGCCARLDGEGHHSPGRLLLSDRRIATALGGLRTHWDRGLEASDVVTAEHMKQLLATGSHPRASGHLGAAYKIYDNLGVERFNAEVAGRVRAAGESRPPHDVLARVRSEVAREYFVADHEREAVTTRKQWDALARYSRPRQQAVDGYDLAFSRCRRPGALGRGAYEVGGAIEDAHDAGDGDALDFIEREVLFTAEGRNVTLQVDALAYRGGVHPPRLPRAAPISAHPRRAADKVQTCSGKCLSMYCHVLHGHLVAASAIYNIAWSDA